MTDTNPLWERIEHALWGVTQVYDARDGRGTEVGVHAPVYEVVAAVLPILRRAQADAWDEGQMSADRDWVTGGHARLNPYRYQVEEDTDG